jgi:hypothetical protein
MSKILRNSRAGMGAPKKLSNIKYPQTKEKGSNLLKIPGKILLSNSQGQNEVFFKKLCGLKGSRGFL